MDFEEFRKKKKAQKEAEKKTEETYSGPTSSGKPMDWVDGFGPSGPTNPKVPGFTLGRYNKVKVDPDEIKKPKGYEAVYRKPAPGPSKAELEMERRKAALEKAEADLKEMEEQRELKEIEARKRAQGISSIKKQRY